MKDLPSPPASTSPIDLDELRSRQRDLALAPRVALLLVHQEGIVSRELAVGEPVVVGREAPFPSPSPSPSDVCVGDTTLSRRHASFALRPDREHVDVEDLASTNGTWQGSRRVERAVLGPGDEIMLGGVLARIRRLAAPPDEGARPHGAPTIIAGAALAAVLQAAERAADSRITILLQGETGTGKEVIARHIHASSPRAAGPMIAVNCGAIPRELIESTFFGHERGAFTGAARTQRGVFEAAHGGTVFLDEIGELPPAAQVALLRVLETGRVVRVGSSEENAVDVRVITATNRDLAAMSEAQGFRTDLYFRLSALTLDIPPLRERREDIEPLARFLLAAANRTHGRRVEDIAPGALRVLSAYSWPGNVRELRNVIERAVVLATGDVIDVAALPERLRAAAASPAAPAGTATPGGSPAAAASVAPAASVASVASAAPAAPEARGRDQPASSDDPGASGGRLRERVQAYETEIIRAALAAAGGSRSEAARALGMPLRTLANRIKALGIDEDDL